MELQKDLEVAGTAFPMKLQQHECLLTLQDSSCAKKTINAAGSKSFDAASEILVEYSLLRAGKSWLNSSHCKKKKGCLEEYCLPQNTTPLKVKIAGRNIMVRAFLQHMLLAESMLLKEGRMESYTRIFSIRI
uniref:PPUP8688 n=1 Tax=Poeciliopsis prolifica TaxID=188132 RepID=A0A0S7ETG9_9TELE